MTLNQDTLLKDRYRIISLLGHGGMGAVHLAYDTALDMQVAVKGNRNPGEESTQQFLREARLLATLRHPNLPRVIDHFIVEDTQYLVMDYIPGKDLETLLSEEGIPPLNRVLDWIRQLGSALSYLHSQNPPVIHRDIKPANVKITPEGQAILVDFGLAKASDPSQATAAGATGYTPGYAPPEQYGGAHTGNYSDQYSLAATLYKLLTNQKPVESIKRLLGESVLTPMQGLNPSVPAYIQSPIEKGMALQPKDRYPGIDEFVRALSDTAFQPTVQRQEHASVATVSAARGEKKPSKALLFTCLGLVIAAVLLGAGGGGVWYFVFRETPAPTQTSPPPVVAVVENTDEPTATVTPPPPSDTPQPPAATTQAVSATPSPTSTEGATPTATARFLVDENQVAFVSDRADGETLQIWTMRVGQTTTNEIIALDLEQLTFDAGSKYEPAWSPDGSKILYSAPGSSGDNLQIWVLEVESGAQTQLTDLNGNNFNPAWSPDGKQVAFANFGRFIDVFAVYLMDADGRNLSRLSLDFQETDPIWTPDGQWLLYVIHARDHQYFFWRSSQTDYATPEPFDPTSFYGRMGEVDEPAITADGSFMAYTRLEGNSRQIWIVEFKSRGGSTTLLTSGYNQEYHASWSPDGQWIVFTSERDGNPEIYVMTFVGILQTNLTNHPAIDMQPDWRK